MTLEDMITDAVRDLPEYHRFHTAEKALLRIPGLKAEVDEFRRRLYEIYASDDANDLIVRTNELKEQFSDLLAMPETGAFLRAEASLSRRMRQLIERGVRAGDLRSPL